MSDSCRIRDPAESGWATLVSRSRDLPPRSLAPRGRVKTVSLFVAVRDLFVIRVIREILGQTIWGLTTFVPSHPTYSFLYSLFKIFLFHLRSEESLFRDSIVPSRLCVSARVNTTVRTADPAKLVLSVREYQSYGSEFVGDFQ